MKITMYPFKPFEVNNGQVTIIQTASSKVYVNLVKLFKNEDDRIGLITQNDEEVSLAANTEWYGDPLMNDLDALFKSKVQRKLTTWIDNNSREDLIQLTNQMNDVMTDVLFGMDLPITVSKEWDLLKCLKFLGIQFTELARNNPYDIIEAILKISHDLKDSQVICLTNVFHYLDMERFSELANLGKTFGSKIFLIDFSETNQRDKFKDYCYYFIDDDLVEWHD
ncbi:type II-A CRISPR-associated protein Csn2 [Secundilactobacillus silagei]|uniref:CRISPR-associated protein Csn2 n=1 Tax=Secundilactobacillus silagei JCM 19001 TaxID=1302250 RepID=A0A1Z5H3Q6_9LACO|nr:type II-A CRISPR-associated protein Csn2 [Secundilactobacillus silagei]TDG70292.1 hypothetical protein C5L25_001482 [Secundilactobacillus silagei JCM 19001]GAT17936.1 CRISPR-associated protein Csn2 [Secundilactobacillus silagei JCM 19001]